jgi:hypothetical protein
MKVFGVENIIKRNILVQNVNIQKMDKIDLTTEKDINRSFLELFQEKLTALEERIKFANDQLNRVNYNIEKFYLEEDIFSGQQEITIHKIKSNELIDRKLLRYKIILGLISEKYTILQERIRSGFYKDTYDIADKKIELFRLQIEIYAKKEFIEAGKKRKL